mgnify:CR=1 FL=1
MEELGAKQWHKTTKVHFEGGAETTYAKALRRREVRAPYVQKMRKPGKPLAQIMYEVGAKMKEQEEQTW